MTHNSFAEPDENAISARNVNKQYGEQMVLRHLNLDIGHGEFVCLLGASGCGKSTILRLLAGLEVPDPAATAEQDAPRLELRANEKTAGSVPRLGFVFQQPNLLPWRTVNENVGLPLRLQGTQASVRRSEIERSLREVGLSAADGAKWPRMLSGGMQMRASLARALVTRPQIMLLDEPFSALDEVLRQRLGEELRQWHRQFGWTTIFVTHHVSEAVFLADRVLMLRTLQSGSAQDSLAADIAINIPETRSAELREKRHYVEEVIRVTKTFRELQA